MAHNSLAPGFVKLYYSFNSITHVQTLPVKPQGSITVGSEPDFEQNDGTPVAMSAAIDEYVTLFEQYFGSTTNVLYAEFWSQPLSTDDPIWVYTHAIGTVGASGTASANASQLVITYRTSLGGLFKHYFMEITGAVALNTRDPYPFVASSTNDLMSTYLMAPEGWIYGRDGGELVVPLYATSKTNDALRKRRIGL